MGNSQPQNPNPNEYDLKVDAQVEKFIDLKQKLTYFLITASVAIIAFLFNFVTKYRSEAESFVWLVITSSIAGLLTSGFSLISLYLGLESYRKHIDNRYKKKNYGSLTVEEKAEWDWFNIWASNFLKYAFIFLFIEIMFAIVFFYYVF